MRQTLGEILARPYRRLAVKIKWYRWAEKLPPFDTPVVFYSEISGEMKVGTWSQPTCSNHVEVIHSLKTGKWLTYGSCIGSATHWYPVIPKWPAPPTKSSGAGENIAQQPQVETVAPCELSGRCGKHKTVHCQPAGCDLYKPRHQPVR
jgi:hypothetical protein